MIIVTGFVTRYYAGYGWETILIKSTAARRPNLIKLTLLPIPKLQRFSLSDYEVILIIDLLMLRKLFWFLKKIIFRD